MTTLINKGYASYYLIPLLSFLHFIISPFSQVLPWVMLALAKALTLQHSLVMQKTT